MTATAETTYERTADPVRRQRLGIAAVTIAVAGLIALVGGVLWPEPASGDWYSYADITPIRDRWWTVLTLLAVSAAVAVPLQALAAMALVRKRGSGWATWGGAAMFLGTGLQVTGVAGWASLYYFATDPSGDPTAVASLLDTVGDDPRLIALAAAAPSSSRSAPRRRRSGCGARARCRAGSRSCRWRSCRRSSSRTRERSA